MEGRFEGRRIPFQFSSLSLLRGSVVPRPMWQDVLGKLVAGTSSQSVTRHKNIVINAKRRRFFMIRRALTTKDSYKSSQSCITAPILCGTSSVPACWCVSRSLKFVLFRVGATFARPRKNPFEVTHCHGPTDCA